MGLYFLPLNPSSKIGNLWDSRDEGELLQTLKNDPTAKISLQNHLISLPNLEGNLLINKTLTIKVLQVLVDDLKPETEKNEDFFLKKMTALFERHFFETSPSDEEVLLHANLVVSLLQKQLIPNPTFPFEQLEREVERGEMDGDSFDQYNEALQHLKILIKKWIKDGQLDVFKNAFLATPRLMHEAVYKICEEEDSDFFSKALSQEERFELAEHLLREKGPAFFSSYHPDYRLTEQQFNKLTLMSAELDPYDTLVCLENYYINPETEKGRQLLIQIAIQIAHQGGPISQHIEKFKIDPETSEGQKTLIQLAKIAAASDGYGISEFIKNYQIKTDTEEGRQALVEIAMIAAKKNGENFSQFIHKYDFGVEGEEKQKLWIHLAKEAMKSSESGAKYIQNYSLSPNIPGERAALIEIATVAATHNSFALVTSIKNWGFDPNNSEDKQVLIQLAELSAQHELSMIPRYIENFGFRADTPEERQILIRIAKLAAKADGEEISNHIKNFKIDEKTPEGQAALIEIAKLAAQQNGNKTSKYIQNFKINEKTPEGQAALIEIAKLAAQQNGNKTSKYILNYQIDSESEIGQQGLIEIAKIAAHHQGFASRVSHYLIKTQTKQGQLAMIEIAKIAARSDAESTALYITNFQIQKETPEGKKALIEIAKITALLDSEKTSFGIPNFGLDPAIPEDLEALIEIAKLAAQQNNAAFSKYIQNYGIKDQATLLEIAKIGFLQTGIEFLTYFDRYEFNDESIKKQTDPINNLIYQFIKQLASLDKESSLETSFNALAVKSLLNKFGGAIGLELDSIIEDLTHKKGKDDSKQPLEDYMVRNQLIWLAKSLVLIGNNSTTLVPFSSIAPWFKKTLRKCVSIHNPELRNSIIKLSLQTLNHHYARAFFHDLQREQPREHFFLPTLATASLIAHQLDLESAQKVSTAIFTLKNAIKERQFNEAFYRFINYCNEQKNLSPDDIANLITLVFTPELKGNQKVYSKTTLINNLNTIRNIGQLAGAEALKMEELSEQMAEWQQKEPNKKNDNSSFLNSYFLELFKKTVPIEPRSDFAIRYQETFGSEHSRDPTAIIRYAAALKTLPSEEQTKALNALAMFVNYVLKGIPAAKEKRLDLADNLHLQTIFTHYPTLKEVWAKSLDPVKLESSEETKTLNISDFFHKKVVVDKHIKLPVLEEHLKNKSIEQPPVSKDRDKAQQLLIEITSDSFLQLERVKKIEKIDQVIDLLNLSNTHPFLQDLKDLKMMLSNHAPKASGLTVVDSDDPFDLLLCGTEILGSCQRVDGNSKQNKGLLGYLLDGKNRLIAVKGSNGKIASRSLLRLVWDDTENKPVLFLARMYPDNISKAHQKAIIALAIEKAKAMQLDLVSVEVEQDSVATPYPNPIKGLGGPAPYEYVDEADGIALDGIYVTKQAFYLWKNIYNPKPAANKEMNMTR